MIRYTYTLIKRLTILVVGLTTIAIGVVMLVTPGPAVIVIPVGLAILATEFVWARIVLRKMRDQVDGLRGRSARGNAGAGEEKPR